MPPREKPEKPQQRHTPEITEDSVPDRPEISPDDMRRRDQLETPDSLPDIEEDVRLGLGAFTSDGGDDTHPTHDEAMDDLESEDVEEMIDEAERGKLERRTEDETIDPRATTEFAAGSSDPLDQSDRSPFKTPVP